MTMIYFLKPHWRFPEGKKRAKVPPLVAKSKSKLDTVKKQLKATKRRKRFTQILAFLGLDI